MSENLSCPFCGGTTIITNRITTWTDQAAMKCADCGAQGPIKGSLPKVEDNVIVGMTTPDYEAQQAWNNRHKTS